MLIVTKGTWILMGSIPFETFLYSLNPAFKYVYGHNSFFSSSMSGRVLRNSSGMSVVVLYVATPIGLL